MDTMTFQDLKCFHNKYFSLGNLGTDINSKFALISLIGYLVTNLKKKNPDVTFYSTIAKINEDIHLPDDLVKGLAIVCEDFAFNCTNFPTFDIQPKDIVKTIKDILALWMPF